MNSCNPTGWGSSGTVSCSQRDHVIHVNMMCAPNMISLDGLAWGRSEAALAQMMILIANKIVIVGTDISVTGW